MEDHESSRKTTHVVYSFTEKKNVLELINRLYIIFNDKLALESDLEKLTSICDAYQEQPHLLDPHLDEIICSCLKIVRNGDVCLAAFHQAFRYLYLICKTRGAKYTLRWFSHEVADLEPVLALLLQQNIHDCATWQTRYVLLLWLSIVCMIPFDLAKFDCSEYGSNGSITHSIINTTKMYLGVVDKSRDAAAVLLARFLSRPDVKSQQLPDCLDWCLANIADAKTSTSEGLNTTLGILTVLCNIFKHGKREDLLLHASTILSSIEAKDFLSKKDILLKKLTVKLVQRLGLCFLKPKVATWRYQRGNRSLLHNLKNPFGADDSEPYDVPETIELILQQLLIGLGDRDTVVRWSAAKGIGRISSRLPKDLVGDIITTILDFFSPMETDYGWHGGCLALAELGKRGLLLPERLSEVVPIIVKALVFDEKRGKCSTGSHVRDAACYVCWSFARAYDPVELLGYVSVIASSLVIVSIFDREPNCRRAASAAFQEHVGRQGKFPNGIDILTTVDYFAVGNITNCYLNLSVYVAQFPEYTSSILNHLIHDKVAHWDSNVRDLCAKSLARVSPFDPDFMKDRGLPILLDYTTSFDLNTRHGGILATAEVVHALFLHFSGCANIWCTDKVLQSLKNIVPYLKDKGYFSGVEGDFMKYAVCKLVEKLCQSRIAFELDYVTDYWQTVINDCLSHTIPEIREVATTSLHELCQFFYKDQDGRPRPSVQGQLVQQFLAKLKSNLRFDRMGFALGLGAFPGFFIRGMKHAILNGLLDATVIESGTAGLFAECRRDAVRSLARICTELGISDDKVDDHAIDEEDLSKILKCFIRCMQDYSIDRRGDVGAWVREAAMTGLERLCNLIVNKNPSIMNADMSKDIIMHLVKQSGEKIDRTRAHAARTLHRIIQLEPHLPDIPHFEELQICFPKSELDEINWAAPAVAFPKITNLLRLKTYRKALLLGLAVSAGGITESLVRHSSQSLLQYLQSIQESDARIDEFVNEMMEILKDNYKNDRVTVPLLKVIDLLISNGCFDSFTERPREGILERLLQIVKNEIHRSGDAKKLLCGIKICCGLTQFSGEVRFKSLAQLMTMLCHRYPRVRTETALDLYTALITYDDITKEDDDDDEVLTILSETEWDSNVEELRDIRNKLCSLLKVPVPKLKRRGEGKELKAKVDMLESYQVTHQKNDKFTVIRRCYAKGEYENLWAAATGGRGTGRGRKKKINIAPNPENLFFGKAQMVWPGLTKPIKLGLQDRKDKDDFETELKYDQSKERARLPGMNVRGWSGRAWPGKHVGPPQTSNGETLEDFDSIVIEVKRTAVQKKLGKKRTVSAVVVTGNGSGAVGWAIGKAQNPMAAIRKARNKAANYLHYIPICDNHTIFHNLRTKYEATKIIFERRPAGHGLRCQRIIKAVAELAGIKDMRCKLVGSNTPQRIVKATFQGLKSQETHGDLANRTGKNVVEYRPEMGMRPVVVASPTMEAVEARLRSEIEKKNEDIAAFFDPSKGLHTAKSARKL